ncbi:MAG TPA: phosphate ABC transporter permease subunit PstC [Gammaproteobacteria bacterium]|nr:phosphate ABC transporter permease subunit PstC [Gammaproteobacteria bacterium]
MTLAIKPPLLDIRPSRTPLPDRLFRACTAFAALLVFGSVIAILVALWMGAWPALHKFGIGFLGSTAWNPVTSEFGAFVAIYGTLVSTLVAMLIAVPLSFGIALFITELAPRWLKRPVGTAIELLAAIPSIIYGMWGLFIFAPLFADHVQPWVTDHLAGVPLLGFLFDGPSMGIGMFTAGLILAIMITPFITAVTRDVFELVPPVLKESAYGLGATTTEVVLKVVLPYTKIGVIGGLMLGLGRALGETMAVTFVIGNAYHLSSSLFMPGTTISATLANEFTEAVTPIYTSSLIALGLILFVITFVVLALAQLLILRTAQPRLHRT